MVAAVVADHSEADVVVVEGAAEGMEEDTLVPTLPRLVTVVGEERSRIPFDQAS
jgi:hypothetical protein